MESERSEIIDTNPEQFDQSSIFQTNKSGDININGSEFPIENEFL